MAHVRAWLLEHKRRTVAVRFGQTDFVWGYVGVVPRLRCGLGHVRWVVHFQYILLFSYVLLLLVSFLVPDHFQVLYFCLWRWWKAFLHSLLGLLVVALKLVSLLLVLYYVGLTHGEFRYGGLHFTCEVPESRLELVDLL